MPPKRHPTKNTLKLDCEWGSCQESFSRMENFCKHVESHLNASDLPEEDEDDAEGVVLKFSSWIYLFLTKLQEWPMSIL